MITQKTNWEKRYWMKWIKRYCLKFSRWHKEKLDIVTFFTLINCIFLISPRQRKKNFQFIEWNGFSINWNEILTIVFFDMTQVSTKFFYNMKKRENKSTQWIVVVYFVDCSDVARESNRTYTQSRYALYKEYIFFLFNNPTKKEMNERTK